MSKISKEEVKQISYLARLELKDADIKKYQNELTTILEYVDTIKAAKTDSIIPTAQVTGLTDVTRKDIKTSSTLTRDKILSNAPQKKDGYIRVKQVLD